MPQGEHGWILIMDTRSYAIGPFAWSVEAVRYAEGLGLSPTQYQVQELVPPTL